MDTLDFRQNEAKYSGVFQHLNDAIFIHDLEGHFLDVNETACERLGYNKEELLRMTPSDIDTHEFAVKVPERIKELQKKGRLIFETAHITKDGRVIPIELSSTIIQFEDKPAILSIARDISERKRMQEELKESEEKYRLISEHANDLITIFNSRLEYEYINKEPHFRILGYSKDDLIGKSISEFLYPDDFKHPFTSYDYDFESIGRELRFKRKDGTYIWLEVRGRTFISKEKEIKVILIWREISERKESEGVVLESEEKFRTIAEQSLMGIAIVQDNLIKYVNYAISKISGYSISQMTGWTINDFMKKIYPEDLVFVLEQLSKKQLGDKDVVVNYPCRIISKSGEIKWIDLYSKSIIFKGRLADMITFIDITEKMNVEQQLKESEEKYRLLSENSLDLITVLDDKFKVEYFNIETQKRVLGVAIHNAIVNRELGQIHPDDFETAIKLIKKCFDTNEPVTGEIRLKHIDGHYIWFECKANTFFDREGEKKLLIISRDITERKQTEEKLRESEEKFRTITEQSLMGICIVQNNSIKYANEAMSEIVEYAISEMMEWKPNDLFRLIVPENLSYAKEEAKILQERKRKGITHDRYRILTKSGTLKWVDTYAKSIKFQEKNAALVTFIDATKRIEAEQKLRESEEKFRETLDLLPDIVFEANTNLDLYYANQVAFEKFGYNKEEFENGLNISQMIAPVALEKAVNQVKKILNGENLGPDDILLRKKDDSEFWGRIHSRPIYKEGRIIGIRGVISDVTKRKKAEQKLKQSKLITDNLDEALIIFDKDGFVPFINPAYENLTGYKSSEIIGKNGVEVAKKTILQSELDKVLKAFRKALKGEELPPISTYFKHKDGNEIPIEFKTSFVRDQNGDPIQIVAVINDITERKKAEHQLKESEKKYRLITENVNDMISVLNNRFKFEYINSQVHQRIIGYQEDELVSRDALNLIHPKDQQIALNALKRGFKEGEGGGEFRFKHRNGSYIWLETKGKTFVDIDGNEKALLVSREITERKKAEQLLRESEERYRSYIENFYGIAYRGRMDWVPLFFHGAVEEITGYTEEEFLNGNPRWDQIIDEEDFGLLEDNFSDIRSIPNFLCEREYKIIRKDGEIRWIHEFIKNICNESGIPIMVEGTIYDITDRKETELKLIESEEKFRSISEHFSLGIVIFQNSFVKYVNEAAAKICGYSVREILEWKQGEFQKLFHPEDLQLILEKTKKLQKGKKGDFDFYNVRIITKSGQIRYVEDYSKSISYENDLADLITIIDVTDKKIAENKLKESEEKYRHLFEDSPLAIFIADFDGKIVDCNEVVHKMSKYTKEELIGSNFIEFIKSQPDILSKLKRRLNNLIEGKKVLPIEFQTYKKDGVPFWIRLFTSIIEIDNLNFIQVIMQDITEQKIAEDLLKESEEKFKRIFHSIPDLFFMVAEDTTILDYKGRREDLYLPPEEFLTQRMCDILPPKEGKLVLETVKRTISTREPQVIEYSLPINNHIINFEARLLYFSDDLVAIFIRDISERKQAEFKLKESEERYRSFIENFQGIAFQGYQDFSAAFFHGLVEEITGYKEEDFLSGKINWEQLIHPIDKQRIYEQIKLFHESSEQSDVRKYRIINKTGEIRWLSEYTQKFYDEVKKEEGVRGICIDISNEKIAEQKLRESEEKFRNISEQALVGICILQNNSLIYANEAMAKINDVSIQELMTWDIKDLIGRVHKEHTSKAAKRLKSFKSGERKKTSDIYRMITKSNKIKWVEIFSNTFNYKGSPAIVTIIIDITERKEAEQKLLESEEKYRLITENVNDLLVILNPKFKMEYINEKAHKKILGYTKDDLIGKDILQLCHPDDIVKSLEEGKSKWRKREARLETRVRQKSGNYIWVELKGRRFLDDEGKEKFLFIGRDINERKKAEQELIESEEKYRLITENANDIIVVLDKKFKIEYINEQVHKVLGYKREELIGIDTLKLVYPDDAIIGINLWKTNYEKGEGSFEARMKRKDNSYIWLELKGKIFTDFDGKEKLLVIARDIDDRIKSENKLKESEEKYRNIFEKAIYGNVVMKYNKIIMCNEKESSLFGYTSPSDLNGRSVNELIHKDDLPILIDLERNIRKGKKMEHPIIFRGIRRDGKELFVEALAISFPFIEEDCILAFNMDVTERELAQQKLKESEEKYRLISENANDLIAVINEEFKQEYLNNLFYKILGYTRDEILKLSNKLVHPEDLQKLLDNSRKILETGEAAYEIRIKHKDGHYIYLEVNGRSFKDSDGRLKILTISRDITEKKAAEMELMEYRQHLEQMIEDRTRELVIANKQLQLEVDERKKVENELKRSEEKFKSIADLSQDIIVRANLDGKITFANPAAAEFFQKPAEQLIGIHFTEYTYPEDLEKTANALREIIKAGSPRIGFESRLIVPKGIRTVKFSGTVIKDNTGKITGVQATGRDVTELQEELIEKEKLAAVGQLAAGVAHELNTPLANITLKADYISAVVSNETNPPNVDILQKEISAIKDQVKFCAQIVKDLLQFSRKMDLNIKRFELSTLLTELIGLPAISSKIKEKNIEIIFEKEKDVILDADRVLLIQVFQNLIANSIDALENVKNEPKIRISISKINGSVEIKVMDNGIGIRESDLPRIFEPFFSTKQIGKGTGLGLSICRGIIEKHKGKININSIFGKGTEVVIKLPIQNEH